MRIWWRVVAPLANAGFEVIVPDLRGFGRSGLAPDGAYDLATRWCTATSATSAASPPAATWAAS
jgi:alpha-beta hydrolase superfamily lysophospholipase